MKAVDVKRKLYAQKKVNGEWQSPEPSDEEMSFTEMQEKYAGQLRSGANTLGESCEIYVQLSEDEIVLIRIPLEEMRTGEAT